MGEISSRPYVTFSPTTMMGPASFTVGSWLIASKSSYVRLSRLPPNFSRPLGNTSIVSVPNDSICVRM